MAGIFGNLFGGAQQPQQPGVLGQQAQQPLGFANDARWTALGSALLGGRSWSDAGAQFGQALPGAMVANTAFRKDARAEQERLGQNAAWSAAFKKMSGVPTTPEDDAALAQFPEIGIKTLPEKPTPHTDAAKAQADFEAGLITQEQLDQGSGGYRPLVDPAERAERGIAPDDTGPYQVGPDNKTYAVGGGNTNITVGGESLTPGAKKVDEIFAQEYVDWQARGGFTDVQKQLTQLEEAGTRLAEETGLSGPAIGSMPEWALVWAAPEAIEVREAVQEVAQRNLKLVLGSQFTQVEGDKLIARAYNPALSQEENAKRVQRLMQSIELAAEAKQSAADYFEVNGTLRGWKGRLLTMTDIEASLDPGAIPGSSEGGYSDEEIAAEAERRGM